MLQGILFVLFTGIGWEDLPQELGFGSGMTCWRQPRDWQQAEVFEQVHHELLAHLSAAAAIDWSHVCVDASHVRAQRGRATGAEPGRSRQDRLQHHLICDGGGVPLAANRNHVSQLLPLVDAPAA